MARSKREREREREGERERDRQTDRQTDRDKERERMREGETADSQKGGRLKRERTPTLQFNTIGNRAKAVGKTGHFLHLEWPNGSSGKDRDARLKVTSRR